MLDYYDALATVVKPEHVTLDFSAGMKLSAGDGQLLSQLCLQMGYPTEDGDGSSSQTIPLYFTGENPTLTLHCALRHSALSAAASYVWSFIKLRKTYPNPNPSLAIFEVYFPTLNTKHQPQT